MMNRGTQFSGSDTWGRHSQKHADNIFAFLHNDSSQGHMLLATFGIPGEARLLYQAEQVRCKVGTRGRSVSWWIPNVKHIQTLRDETGH